MRLSPIDRNNLNEAQQTVLEAIERGPRGNARPGIGMIGPFGAWVRAPSVGGAAQALGAAIRFGSSVPENIKEVAICTVGAHFKSKFEFSAHKRLGMQAGLNETQLNQLRDGESPTFEGDEMISYRIASEMLETHGITDQTYKAGVDAFTETCMIELVTTIGYYCLISLTLNSFQIPLEDGMEDPFPVV
ncbi:MAG: hypothetical protein ABGY96_30255 [bacterium]|nr:hypothetical protein [Gammaproteobacteria bacterium]